ncbi:MAG TPA: hypothetical protein VGF45_09735, partial [Polyangia bacterium]
MGLAVIGLKKKTEADAAADGTAPGGPNDPASGNGEGGKTDAEKTGPDGQPIKPARGWRGTLSLVKDAASEWNKDAAPRLGAALSYYTVFALAPVLLLAIS